MPNKKPLVDKGIVRVTFTLPAEVKGQVVHLVGEFTGWEGTPMERQRDGSWKTVVDLAPGRSYQYRYQIDGLRWENDWDADHYEANPFGQDNSVVETPPLERGAGAAKKTAAKKTTAKKTAAKKTAAKKTTAKKTTAKKTTAKKTTAKEAAPTNTAAKKVATKKAASTDVAADPTRDRRPPPRS